MLISWCHLFTISPESQKNVTNVTRRVQLVEQELLTLPEHMRSPAVFIQDHVVQS
jgi:hypothetical protein